jgi:hypothetical protein
VSRPLPRRLQLSSEMSPELVSQAWEFLASLQPPSFLNPEPEFPEPPKHLLHLTDADWYLLDGLLCREMTLKELSPLQ